MYIYKKKKEGHELHSYSTQSTYLIFRSGWHSYTNNEQMSSTDYTVTIVLLGQEEKKKESGWFVCIMLYILHNEPNEIILQNQKTILNITDLEPKEGEGDESSTKISAIFYIFIMVQYKKDSSKLNT
jgi:hypothetical protein